MSTQKAYKGMAMEGVIASWYAKTTVRDIHRHKLAAEQMAHSIPQGAGCRRPDRCILLAEQILSLRRPGH